MIAVTWLGRRRSQEIERRYEEGNRQDFSSDKRSDGSAGVLLVVSTLSNSLYLGTAIKPVAGKNSKNVLYNVLTQKLVGN